MSISRFLDLSDESFWIPLDSIEGKRICTDMGMSERYYEEGCEAGLVYNSKTKSFTLPSSIEIEGFDGMFDW